LRLVIEPVASKESYTKYVFAAAATAVVFAAGPASAAMMSCSGENMTKTTTAMGTMQYGPNKRAMDKEMGMANTEMSKGNMRGACSHYMRAQMAGAGAAPHPIVGNM
jgi:hypothetical protein